MDIAEPMTRGLSEAQTPGTNPLFGMCGYIEQVVGIAPDLKIKTPPSIYSGLPDITYLVILLGS